jgi:hypothetical protein
MSSIIYVSNFPPGLTAEQLGDVITEFTPVVSVAIIARPPNTTMPPAAQVEIEVDDFTGVLRRLNKHRLEDRRLAAMPNELIPTGEPSPELQEQIAAIAELLGETEKYALRQIKGIMMLCGPEFTQSILEEAKEIEASGGLKTVDGKRKRTFGGVFFFLARGRMAPELRRAVFSPTAKKKSPAPTQKAKKSQAPKPKKAASAPAAPSVPKPQVPESLPQDLHEYLSQLQQALSEAEDHLRAVKAKAGKQQGGTFSAIKAVLEIKKQINALLKQHPELA